MQDVSIYDYLNLNLSYEPIRNIDFKYIYVHCLVKSIQRIATAEFIYVCNIPIFCLRANVVGTICNFLLFSLSLYTKTMCIKVCGKYMYKFS